MTLLHREGNRREKFSSSFSFMLFAQTYITDNFSLFSSYLIFFVCVPSTLLLLFCFQSTSSYKRVFRICEENCMSFFLLFHRWLSLSWTFRKLSELNSPKIIFWSIENRIRSILQSILHFCLANNPNQINNVLFWMEQYNCLLSTLNKQGKIENRIETQSYSVDHVA